MVAECVVVVVDAFVVGRACYKGGLWEKAGVHASEQRLKQGRSKTDERQTPRFRTKRLCEAKSAFSKHSTTGVPNHQRIGTATTAAVRDESKAAGVVVVVEGVVPDTRAYLDGQQAADESVDGGAGRKRL